MNQKSKLPLSEKIGYALGDGAANIAWRGTATFLLVFYTDVFGLAPAVVGVLLLISRFSDGIVDVLMGIIGDRTNTRWGKFRPWILWTALPLGLILSLLFTTPNWAPGPKIIYAYVTYLLFMFIYTANNIPYGALMAVITGDNKERTMLGSYRMVGAFAGGMIVQGALLYLVAYFGNVDPTIQVQRQGDKQHVVTVSTPADVSNVNIKTKDGIATFRQQLTAENSNDSKPMNTVSFSMKANTPYTFVVEGEENISSEKITIIDQKKGYSYSIYIMSVFLSLFMFITFYTTRERVHPPKDQQTNLRKDFMDLVRNKPWLVLLIIGLLFNVYNNMKQGIVIIYFTHYLNNALLSGSFLVALMLASIAGAMVTGPLGKKWGKRNLFIYALIFSAFINALFVFCGPNDIVPIFTIGIISEFAAAIFPTLFFAMLGDAADYSEFKNGRRATGLVYSAGSFATKFGGGLAGAIIGLVLGAYHYNGQDSQSIAGAIPAIKMLMSWIPSIIAIVAAAVMALYPLNQSKMDDINAELDARRSKEALLNS
jgi:GPH family glycoside/pentoside/hexuronide:cation symporter